MKRSILLIIVVLFSLKLFSYNSLTDWRYIKDERFTIYYPEGQYLYAKYTLNSLREYAPKIDRITSNERKQKVNIVLEDTGEYYNGLANPIENKLRLFLNTPNTSSAFTSQEWLNMLVIHEYTHHSHLTSTKKTPLLLTKIFGNIFSPNLYSPMWIVEGITVRNESFFSPYMGRLNNGYYSEIIQAQLREDSFQNHIKANYYLDDYPLGNYYIYGGAFFKWLSDNYGEEKLTDFFNNYGSNLRNVLWSSLFPKYTLDRSAKIIFNKDFPSLFKQWKNYLEMSANFDKDFRNINIDHDWDNTLLVNNLTSDNKSHLYFFELNKYYKHYRGNIVSYNVETHESEIIYHSNSSLTTNMEVYGNNLYFSEEEGDFTGNNLINLGYSGTSVLKKMDLDEDKSVSVIFKRPFKDFTVAQNGSIYYTTEDNNTMTSSLFKYSRNHHSLVKNFPFLISELSYQDNKIYCTYKYPNSSWDIAEISLIDNAFTPLIITKSQEKNLYLYQNNLLFTSNQANKSQAYSYDLTKSTLSKVSNNFFADNPLIINNTLYFKSISAKGERISQAETVNLPADLELVEDSRLITLIDDDYTENMALSQSMKNLLIPYIRQPLGIMTSDGIGYFDLSANWYLNDDSQGVASLNISSQVLSPLILNYYASSDDNNYLNAQVKLYNSSINWLNDLTVIGQTDFADSNYLGNKVIFRKFNSYLINKYMHDFEDSGFSNKTVLSHNFKKFRLTGFFERIEKFDESPNFSEDKIYDGKATYNDYGLVVDFNLWKIRNGFWNPNVAMRDIDLSLGIYQNDYQTSASTTYYKISTLSEIFMASVLQFNLETGIYFNEKKVIPLISFGTEF